jgi:peroxiredoxin
MLLHALLCISLTPCVQAPVDEFATLLAEYQAAEAAWQAELDALEDVSEKSALRRKHPARAFSARFEAAANAGEGRALLWTLEHLRDSGLRTKEIAEAKPGLYERLVEGHAQAAWFADVLEPLSRDARHVGGAERLRAWYVRIIEAPAQPAVRAQALDLLASSLSRSDDAGEQALGLEWYLRLAREHGDTEWGRAAERAHYVELHLAVGCEAPAFTGTQVDGATFRLADTRGKVTLVAFYGLWSVAGRAALADIERFAGALSGAQFAIVGVDTGDRKDELAAALEEHGILPRFHAWQGEDRAPIAQSYRVASYPMYFLLDGLGVIRAKGTDLRALEAPAATIVEELRKGR